MLSTYPFLKCGVCVLKFLIIFLGAGVDLRSRADALLDVGKQNVFSCLQNILIPISLDLC